MIEEITRNSVGGTEESVLDMLNSSLPDLKREKVEALVQLIKTENSITLSAVKSRTLLSHKICQLLFHVELQ